MNTATRLVPALLGAALLAVIGSSTAQQTAPTAVQPPRGPIEPGSCVTAECHADVKSHRQLHGPVGVDACEACHETMSEIDHTFQLARPGEALCTFCHQLDMGEGMTVHEPLMTGDCGSCHDPHGGASRMFLRSETPADLCRSCHADDVSAGTHMHGPVAAGACTACHAAHASPYPKLLFAEGPAVCTSCHANTMTQLESLRVVHAPVGEDCQSCHDAHASDHPMMLKDETQALCLSCHETIRHMVETATQSHAAVTTERQCLNCHDAHASDHPRMLQTDMMTLCFECHGEEIALEDGTTLANIQQVVETGQSLHGPIAQSNCAACHQIHGGEHFRLLVQEYPPEFYAPFKEERYALCFSCHDPQLVRDATTTSLTDFRNGATNLHFLHVNRDRKGRSCRACHETHASNKANHIRESVPFGPRGWELPINFEKLEAGGSCAPGCHRPYRYDRDDPVPYEPGGEAIWPGEDGTPSGGDAP